eukprot:GHVN01071474.1.p1 GENE.GHVN01071474.1~~GHVN01071474.1.p1  ORF type:complete len:151 (+),score=38.34 GHVN01071474.1:249-701(+)
MRCVKNGDRWLVMLESGEQADRCVSELNDKPMSFLRCGAERGGRVEAEEVGDEGERGERDGTDESHASGVITQIVRCIKSEKSQSPPPSRYEYPDSCFDIFIDYINLLKIEFQNQYEDYGYYETRAVYEIVFVKKEYGDHLAVGSRWYGR